MHVSVRAVGIDGKRLSPGPADLQAWRERFARELRRLGVAAEATPRKARGKVRRAEKLEVHHVTKRGIASTVEASSQREALRSADQTSPPQSQAWNRDILTRQDLIRTAYLRHAADLAEGDVDDRRLATDIRRFVEDMPVPLTRRQVLTVELRNVLERHHQTITASPQLPLPAPSQEPSPPPKSAPSKSSPRIR